jgi:hypothetical protein
MAGSGNIWNRFKSIRKQSRIQTVWLTLPPKIPESLKEKEVKK